jgi:uncharacterized protein (DUF362 family)/NAD-dependent dihydropyrimidine dehydrogenase PreA subunit
MSSLKEKLRKSPVFITDCDTYDAERIRGCISEAFSAIGITRELIENKRVLIKPNLVLAKKPEFAATTHPAFIKAVAQLSEELGASSVTVADSPGGPYNEASLALIYRVCELSPLKDEGIELNSDFSHKAVHLDGVKLKNFNMITPVYDADVIIDLCKLKTHTLTGMSCSTKNLFGVIPGIEKFEMHSNFPKIEDFSEMLVDLSSYILENKTFIAICDAVLSMEGDGPSHGTPKKTDTILVSESPYALDVIAERIIGAVGVTKHLDCAAARDLVDRDWQSITVLGNTDYPVFDFKKPKTETFLRNLPNLMGGRFAKFFESKPKISSRCIGCGKCEQSCPRHTITIEKRGKKKIAKIHRENCIRCYCCQELCPIGAIDTKSNIIIKLIH